MFTRSTHPDTHHQWEAVGEYQRVEESGSYKNKRDTESNVR